jgi:SAM-dependent methyltransferase
MTIPAWLGEVIGAALPQDGGRIEAHGVRLRRDGDILRAEDRSSAAQEQTSDTFGFKWAKRDSFETTIPATMRAWLTERYGDVAHAPWLAEHGSAPVLLDAGCGAALSALELWGPALGRIRYIGADISRAVDVARDRFAERGLAAAFIQASLDRLPLPEASVDLIFSEGVLHHTDDTRAALVGVSRYLKPGGRILFYVYRKKGPIREFTDDYVRDRLQAMSPEAAWAAMEPLTRLGKALGELQVEIDVPERIDLLDIPAGKMDLQRFFYWHVLKAFYRPEMTLDEMNHINFDWYAPRNAHRQTAEEVRAWCGEAGLAIEREDLQLAGITIIAKKRR